jgi:hypothetical protein
LRGQKHAEPSSVSLLLKRFADSSGVGWLEYHNFYNKWQPYLIYIYMPRPYLYLISSLHRHIATTPGPVRWELNKELIPRRPPQPAPRGIRCNRAASRPRWRPWGRAPPGAPDGAPVRAGVVCGSHPTAQPQTILLQAQPQTNDSASTMLRTLLIVCVLVFSSSKMLYSDFTEKVSVWTNKIHEKVR